MKQQDIVYESGQFWVYRKDRGYYQVFKIGPTYSTLCGVVHYSHDPDKALKRAVAECDRRASA